MRFLLAFVLTGFGVLGATVDVPVELARPARDWALFGVDLALPGFLANPATLGFAGDWRFDSTCSSLFGVGQVWAVSLVGPVVGGAATLLDSSGIGADLSYRVWAFQLGVGIPFGRVGIGGKARLLRPVAPKESWGWSVDLGFFWAGPIELGLVAESLFAASPYSGETWARDLSVAASLSYSFPRFFGALGLAFTDIFTVPTWAVAGEVDFGVLALRAGLRSTGLCVGGGVQFRGMVLDWVFTLHPDLPQSFRVSFGLRWP
ncbi:MAG: hypothetical protein NZ651_01865 [Candidatus Bipolaricaulota bacterium]|nr:hypothetical protein [Candidatus Bipolaricaulota bacterium]MDW8126505.1 hypothetical protein [Candidatus Bipolaricaulota bacterium]